MASAERSRWAPMATAPRDGTIVLVKMRATEQGPAEVDRVRWARSARSGEEGWVANDSDPYARVVYADGELSGWSPLPTQMGEQSADEAAKRSDAKTTPRSDADEIDGAGI